MKLVLDQPEKKHRHTCWVLFSFVTKKQEHISQKTLKKRNVNDGIQERCEEESSVLDSLRLLHHPERSCGEIVSWCRNPFLNFEKIFYQLLLYWVGIVQFGYMDGRWNQKDKQKKTVCLHFVVGVSWVGCFILQTDKFYFEESWLVVFCHLL